MIHSRPFHTTVCTDQYKTILTVDILRQINCTKLWKPQFINLPLFPYLQSDSMLQPWIIVVYSVHHIHYSIMIHLSAHIRFYLLQWKTRMTTCMACSIKSNGYFLYHPQRNTRYKLDICYYGKYLPIGRNPFSDR